jgi:hypothetical protein
MIADLIKLYADANIRVAELERENAALKQRILDDNKAYGCELMDPSETIWDHAKRLQQENAALRDAIGESEEFARKNGETAGAKIKELLRENAALQEALACLLDWGLQPPDYWRDQTKDRFIADIQKASNLLKRKEAQP